MLPSLLPFFQRIQIRQVFGPVSGAFVFDQYPLAEEGDCEGAERMEYPVGPCLLKSNSGDLCEDVDA